MSSTVPATKDNFASANGDFYAEASGSNRHRRATPTELKSHFKTSGSEKDKPGHWYEAQLIHYGLLPSKTKAVAFKRLFDVVNSEKLNVPAHIKKVETELKKEWTKRDREAKKEAKGQTTDVKKTAGQKRKADTAVDLKPSVGGVTSTVKATNSAVAQGAAKKAKTVTTKTAAVAKAVKASPKTKAAPKTTKTAATPKAKALATLKETKTAAKAPAKPKPAPKATVVPSHIGPQRARCSRGAMSQGLSRGVTISSPAQPVRQIQTARRGGSFAARGGHARPSSQTRAPFDDDDDDEPPPPYSEHEYRAYDSSSNASNSDALSYDSSQRSGSSGPRDDEPLGRLGLLNGRYEIDSPDVNEQWPRLGNDLSLVLTISGNKLWGSFDLGIYEGVLLFDVRPYESSYESVEFKWRGRENEGEIICGNYNKGSIRFLGDGRIEGEIDRMDIKFSGQRAEGQGTRSEVDAHTMLNEWNGYSEQEYERENRTRWGGSGW